MGALERDRARMVELLEGLRSGEGATATLVDGVTLLRHTRSAPPSPVFYEPCVVIVARGRKRFHLPDRVLTYDARNYFVLTVPVPAGCETEISDGGPFLGFAVRISLELLSELTLMMQTERRPAESSGVQVRAPGMSAGVSSAAIRLLECLRSPSDAAVLGVQMVRELVYRVLRGEAGGALEELLLASEAQARIHRVLHAMHREYKSPLHVPSLAHKAGMSVSALHFHFKAVTQTSPVQYLKAIRLHKARMLMVQDAIGASVAAERVGYESASQFSREFKRLFGAPPADEARRVRGAFEFVDSAAV